MALSSLKDVYIDQLQDIYSANKQSLEVTRLLENAASSQELTDALSRGVKGIGEGLETMSKLVKSHNEDPTEEFCRGMQGLVKEAKAHALDAEFSDDDARDAMIISQYQRMVHYAIAGYGCVAAYARRLGYDDDAKAIQKCLDETAEGDKQMTKIAETKVNKRAA
ncbi:hypothetical protein GCM10011367_16810 [Marinicauda pacifica]|jgi:ferritin-like metal-binding protein YciE|uniref:DUF892 family protein n=1 Tax=Marinicauda pacifica TaxID=1133559 RepID=A0A4S2HAX7_9PROT|nr:MULTISPECIES: DUF892 family protein [Marinicauda]TGY93087.1 DUF892 family protein [Marinicauda pacifica]GGE42698.1 hypothetical protein GCM10011367_16810 [Marinicauda pacifica]